MIKHDKTYSYLSKWKSHEICFIHSLHFLLTEFSVYQKAEVYTQTINEWKNSNSVTQTNSLYILCISSFM